MLFCFCWFVLLVLMMVVVLLGIVWVQVLVVLKVMLFNVCMFVDIDLGKCWEDCCDVMVMLICEQKFEVIGMQELVWKQGEYLVVYLLGYVLFGKDCCGGNGDEYMGVLYDMVCLKVLEFGDFWLFDILDVLGSIIWGNLFLCMVIWVLFQWQVDGQCFYLFNIYLFYCDEDELCWVFGVKLIVLWLVLLFKDILVVVIGDFNSEFGSDIYKMFIVVFGDVCRFVGKVDGLCLIFYDFIGKLMVELDWILVCGFIVDCFSMLDQMFGGVLFLDYYLVQVELCVVVFIVVVGR